MGITAIVLAGLGAICAALGVINILQVTTDPLLSDKLTWEFWMMAAGILLLGAIACLLGRKQHYEE